MAPLRPPRPAHDLDRVALLLYARENVSGWPKEDSDMKLLQFDHGQSNPTYLLEVGSRRFVLRKKPPGKLLKSAHAVEREYQVLAALQNTDVPVPKVYCLCMDMAVIGTPFYIMDFVEGRIFTDPRLPDMAAEERESIYRAMAVTLAAIHRVDVEKALLSTFGRRDSYCRRQVERWTQQYQLSTGNGGPEADPAMLEVIGWLHSNVPPEDEGSAGVHKGLVHGDFRLDNLIFHPTEARVVAVLDWELSTLGNQLSDAAYCCMPHFLPCGVKNLPGLDKETKGLPGGIPDVEKWLALYCDAAKLSRSAVSWRFYLVLSFFRGAAIFAGVYKRALQGNASSANAAGTGEVAGLLARIALRISKEPSNFPALPRQVSTAYATDSRSPKGAMISKDHNSAPQQTITGFMPSGRAAELRQRVDVFMKEHVYPNEDILEKHAASTERWNVHPLVEQLKTKAQGEGLWNLWIPAESAALAGDILQEGNLQNFRNLVGLGLSNAEYAHVCEVMGRSVWSPELFNCSAPDTGNMEVLLRYGSKEQQRQWLLPLLEGRIRSCFAMTEPQVASSDATNIESSIRLEGDELVLNGRKWWTSGACDPRCRLAIFMGKSSPNAPPHRQQSMVLVDMQAPGVKVVRPLTVFGYDDAPHGHAEMIFDDVRVPASNLLLGEGRGFEIAQGRLGPGRLHHCMRLIGASERALESAVQRSVERRAFGKRLAQQGAVLHQLAECRVDIEAARLMVLQAALQLDLHGNKLARNAIAMAKVVAPRTAQKVLDAAIQLHGGGGVSGDFPLARLWAAARTLRIADGPDEVHLGTIGRLEVAKARL